MNVDEAVRALGVIGLRIAIAGHADVWRQP